MTKEELDSFLTKCSYEDLWLLKGLCETKLVSFGVETNNFVGERAVDLAKEVYTKTRGLPNLERPRWATTKEVDLYSINFEGYSVKGVKGNNKVTSPFCGFEGPETPKLFDFVILVRLNELYELEEMLEIDWDTFKAFARRNARDKNYKLTLTNKLRNSAKIIYSRTQQSS